jgi:hypothetical protein
MSFQRTRIATLAMGLFAVLMQPLHAQFRKASFGMKMEDVVTEEKAIFLRATPLAVIYQDALFGFEALVAYHFCPLEDTLCKGTYTINTTGYEIEEILDHYMKVKRVMDHRYGESLKSGIVWWDEAARKRNDIVNAFRFAEAEIRNEWYGPGVYISLHLSNQLNTQGEIVYSIIYEPGREFDLSRDMVKL